MNLDIRPVTEEEIEPIFAALSLAFSHPLSAEHKAEERRLLEVDRTLGAFDGPDVVGAAGAYSMELTIPGATIPLAGVTGVGVIPSHRRRNVLTALMKRQLEDVRHRGEAVAGLWASEGSIYGRFGYGTATFAANIRVDRDRARLARDIPDPGRVVSVSRDEALKGFPDVYDRLRTSRPGMLARNQVWWEVLYADLKEWRDGASEYFFAVHESSEGPDGCVSYRARRDWSDALPGGALEVEELLAETPSSYAALWRFVFGIDLIATIEASKRPVDDALIFMVAEPRRLRLRLQEGLWIRLVDVPVALAARGYAAPGRVVLEVHDGFCPWAGGRFELESEGPHGGAVCTRTDAEPDVELEAADLGALYLGGVRPRSLQEAGRIRERTPGAIPRLTAMFAWDVAPWCSHVF